MKATTKLIALVLGLMLAVPFAASAAASPDDLPCSAIKLIVPWGAGGGTDILMRTIANATQEELGKDIAVVNISGQGGNKGAKEALDARPNGCTLFAGHDSMETSYLSGRVDFNYFAFQPIALVTHTPSIVGANVDTAWNSMNDLIADGKKRPGEILFGATLGSTSHFFPLMIEDETGAKFKYVPYDGTRQRMTALLAGNIDLGEINITAAQQYIKEGSLKALGIATEERDKRLPDVPTLKEQGVDVVYGVNRGIFTQKGVPDDIVAMYEDAFRRATQRQDVTESIEGKGSVVQFKGTDAYVSFLKQKSQRTERIAKNVGIAK